MKNKLVVFASLSLMLSAWLIVAYVSSIHAGEAGEAKTVILRVEGMT